VPSIDRIDRKSFRGGKAPQIAVFHVGDLRSILVMAVDKAVSVDDVKG
jgi:hypothetical protein